MTTLYIFGDSWGCGSWSTEDNGWQDNGDGYVTELFSKSYDVKNYSQGGISNLSILNIMHNNLVSLPTSELHNSKFLVIQTDPTRDMLLTAKYYSIPDTCLEIFEHINFKAYVETTIDLFYFNLNMFAVHYGIIINVVGGCSDIDNLINKYSNLHVACRSFFQLIHLDFTPTLLSTGLGEIEKILPNFSKSNLAVVTSMSNKLRIQTEESGNYFGWNNDTHLSHKGIDLWIDNINRNLI